jgi:hypothetical protein
LLVLVLDEFEGVVDHEWQLHAPAHRVRCRRLRLIGGPIVALVCHSIYLRALRGEVGTNLSDIKLFPQIVDAGLVPDIVGDYVLVFVLQEEETLLSLLFGYVLSSNVGHYPIYLLHFLFVQRIQHEEWI